MEEVQQYDTAQFILHCVLLKNSGTTYWLAALEQHVCPFYPHFATYTYTCSVQVLEAPLVYAFPLKEENGFGEVTTLLEM